jgi:hypothetical protein
MYLYDAIVNDVRKENLKNKLKEPTVNLLHLAEDLCWNKISPNCMYYLSEDPNDGTGLGGAFLKRPPKGKLNLQTLDELVPVLNELYSDLYDIKLVIRHAYKRCTVIDVRYIKWDFEYGSRDEYGEPLPLIDIKVELPPTYKEGKKIDINWQDDTLKLRIKLFWYRMKSWIFDRHQR